MARLSEGTVQLLEDELVRLRGERVRARVAACREGDDAPVGWDDLTWRKVITHLEERIVEIDRDLGRSARMYPDRTVTPSELERLQTRGEVMKREDGYYWVRGIAEPPFGGGRAMVAEWRDGAWGFAADDELRADRYFEVLSEKLEPPVERSPFEVIADMAAKQMAETIREDRVKPLKETVYVKLAVSDAESDSEASNAG